MRRSLDHYATLRLVPSSTHEEIRDRFRFLSHAFHPDKFHRSEYRQLAEEEFKAINAAYHILSDPKRREHFDIRLQGARHDTDQTEVATGFQRNPAARELYAILNLPPKATTREVLGRCQFLTNAFQPNISLKLHFSQFVDSLFSRKHVAFLDELRFVIEYENTRSICAEPDRFPAHWRGAHGIVQLALCPSHRGHIHPAH
jgi:hypothetical protein